MTDTEVYKFLVNEGHNEIPALTLADPRARWASVSTNHTCKSSDRIELS